MPGPCIFLIGMIAGLSAVPGEGAGFQLLDQSIMDFRFSATVMGAAVAAFTCSTVNSGIHIHKKMGYGYKIGLLYGGYAIKASHREFVNRMVYWL